jgi:hypothetical protein
MRSEPGIADESVELLQLLAPTDDPHRLGRLGTYEVSGVVGGQQQGLIQLKTDKAIPITLRFQDESGKPATGIRALPARRTTKDGQEYLNYAHQLWNSGVPTDGKGEVRFASWRPGESGMIRYLVNNEIKELKLTIPKSRVVSITVEPSKPKPPAGPPIHVAGRVVDVAGKPLPNVAVLAVQKRWPNNRYRQDALSTTTNENGEFRFDEFATGGRQYAFLLTVIADGYAMTSDYQLVKDGAQRDAVTLTVERVEPVRFVIRDADGSPVPNVQLSPSERTVDSSTSYLNYSMHMEASGKRTDENGEAAFTAWKPGESGSLYFHHESQYGELEFTVAEGRRVVLTLPSSK